MVLLNPTFDVHIRRINSLKLSAFAASEKAKRPLQEFFKANDFSHPFTDETLKEFVKYCQRKKLKIDYDSSVRHRNERFKN